MPSAVTLPRQPRLPAAAALGPAATAPVAPSPDLRCRDGHYLIEDWRTAQARIEAARDEARKARRIATTLTAFGATAAVAGVAGLVLAGLTSPLAVLATIVGVGLVAASGLLRLASATKVASVTRRAHAASERAAKTCRSHTA